MVPQRAQYSPYASSAVGVISPASASTMVTPSAERIGWSSAGATKETSCPRRASSLAIGAYGNTSPRYAMEYTTMRAMAFGQSLVTVMRLIVGIEQ